MARFSASPPLSGQSGVAPVGRGFFNRLTLQGLFAGWVLRSRVHRAGGVLLSGRVARSPRRPLVSCGCGRRSRRFARLSALCPLRPLCVRPHPRFSPFRSRARLRQFKIVIQNLSRYPLSRD